MKKVLITAVVLSASALTVQADATSFNQLDTDKNNAISQTEAQPMPELIAAFDELDTNGDGELNAEEFEASSGKQ